MKILIMALLLLSGCSSAVLTSPGRVYPRTSNHGVPIQCAIVNEFDTSNTRPDKKKESCWCMYPFGRAPGLGMVIPFVLSADALCQPGDVKVPVVKTKNSDVEETL